MARYVMANRRAGKFAETDKVASQAAVAVALDSIAASVGAASVDVVEDNQPDDPLARRVVVFEASAKEIELQRASLPPDVLVEPDILHWPEAIPPRDFSPVRRLESVQPLDAALAQPVVVTVTAAGSPLPNAEVTLYVRGLGGVIELRGQSGAEGTATFLLAPGQSAAAALVTPAGSFWPMVARGAAIASPIECPPLPQGGPLGWWHGALGIQQADETLGAGIKVGIVDTGVGPHPSLAHVRALGAFLNSAPAAYPANAADVGSHGTHVAAIVGARPATNTDYAGIAPGCELFAARVYPSSTAGASQADIVNAIDALSRTHQVDLINLSLGTDTASQILHDAIIDAFERGTLCICAAGNSAGKVLFPAAFPETVAVSAIGLEGWGPPGTLTATRLPQISGYFGRDSLFLANFSCHGAEIACAAPGVGIVAAVPNHFGDAPLHAAMDGTSMAGPAVSGALAALLARNIEYNALPRDEIRAAAARRLLTERLRDIGLDAGLQGRGVPSLSTTVV